MTMFKQIAIVVSLVFVIFVGIVMATSLSQYREIVSGQLQTAAQDMVTTLGIAIGNSAYSMDQPAYETLFNAVFDSGYYSSINLVSPEGSMIQSKSRQLAVEGVPDWFVAAVPIDPATASTQVMQGWTQIGVLKLTLHPGYVYYGLYENLKNALLWFVLLFTAAMVLLWLLLHFLLKPLIKVKQQADAIYANRFVKQTMVPHTAELRVVVSAMNRMVDKVHSLFDDQERALSRYQKLLYEDRLTGLSNRQHFMSLLESAHSSEAEFHCRVAVIKILNYESIREHYGYEKSDKVVKTLAALLKERVNLHENFQIARLSMDEFALIIPADQKAVAEFVDAVFADFKASTDIDEMQHDIALVAGISDVNVGRGISQTLADTDFALAQAEACGAYSIKEAQTSGLDLPQGKSQWRNWLENCIEHHKFYLVRQNVVDSAGETIHQEVFIRLKNDKNETVPAGMFMPMANALNLGESLDRVVFGLIKEASTKSSEIPIALNLTASVFSHADALVAFHQLLVFFKEKSLGLCVEASHTILEKYPAMCVQVADSVREAGHRFGIDNLNITRSIHELRMVRPDYIKINATTLFDMTQSELPAGFDALLTMTRTMDIELIAVGVDNEEIHDHLKELGIAVMQGNLLAAPEEFL